MKTIKRYAPFVIIAYLFIVSSCSKNAKKLELTTQIANINFTIDTTSNVGVVDLGMTAFNYDLTQFLFLNNIKYSDVEKIEVTGAEFSIVSPAGDNFDAIDTVYTYMSASGLTEMPIAYYERIPRGKSTLKLNPVATDVKNYLNQTTVSLRIEGYTNSPIAFRDSVAAKLTFKISTKIPV
jgi:hypothetical protein